MGWTLEEFNDCFHHGIVLRARMKNEDGTLSGFRIRRKKWTYYEDGPQLMWKVDPTEQDEFKVYEIGDLFFKYGKDNEITALRPGVNMPPIEVREQKLRK